MISKELLREVLASPTKVDYYGLSLFGYGNRNLMFKWKSSIDGTEVEDSINIYELAYKCKEWAFKQGYELFSRILSNDSQMRGNCLIIKAESDPETVVKIENEKTEPEAIFKACQWILDNAKS